MLNTLSDCTHEKRTEPKVRTVFLLGPTEREALEQLSADTGAPVSELLRRSVVSYLNKEGEAHERFGTGLAYRTAAS